MIIIHDDKGTTYGPRAYMDIVDSRHRLPTRHDRYFTGKEKPNYSVPAIRVRFEYGRNLSTGEVVLIKWEQGRY